MKFVKHQAAHLQERALLNHTIFSSSQTGETVPLMYTQPPMDFIGPHEDLKSKLGGIFRGRTLLFPSLTMCSLG
jgi:hypothetical protein